MCGRFNYVISEGMVNLMDELELPIPGVTRYNIAPTEHIHIIRQSLNHLEVKDARWWLVPNWSEGPNGQFAMFNARSETLSRSLAFREPFKNKRCLIPATSYIEWKRENGCKQAYEIYGEQPFLFAGIWDEWNGEITSCSMITTQANDSLSVIHDRMPVILNGHQAKQWLDMDVPCNELEYLFRPNLESPIHYHAVHHSIGNARNKTKPVKVTGNSNLPLF